MSFLDAREHGSKPGSGFLSITQENVDRRERLRRLALETIDLEKDPYFMRNHLGQYECKLCLTLHSNEGSYLAHTQGKRHQQNLAKRAAREALDKHVLPIVEKRTALKKVIRIGRPGYRVTKQFDIATAQRSLLFQIEYPEIDDGCRPRHRFMSAYEQHKEPTDRKYQYALFQADPYDIIAFKVPSYEVDSNDPRTSGCSLQQLGVSPPVHTDKFFVHWDLEKKLYTLQLYFKNPRENRRQPPRPASTVPTLVVPVPSNNPVI
jgi:splicing factor 3A subunit 2